MTDKMSNKTAIKIGKVMSPPSRQKISDVLRILLDKKNFQAISTAEISDEAGVNQALIFRHFGKKRDCFIRF